MRRLQLQANISARALHQRELAQRAARRIVKAWGAPAWVCARALLPMSSVLTLHPHVAHNGGPRDRRATTGHGQDSAAHTRPGHGARRPRPHGSRTTHRTQNSRRLRLPGTSVPRTARTLNTPFTTGASRCGRVHIAARRGKTETTPHTRHTLFYRKPATWSCTRHQQLRHSGYHAGAPMARHDQAAWGQH